MNLEQIERLINDSFSNSSNINKVNATQVIEQIKNDSNKWNIGLELFYSSSSDVSKLFGLTRKLFFLLLFLLLFSFLYTSLLFFDSYFLIFFSCKRLFKSLYKFNIFK